MGELVDLTSRVRYTPDVVAIACGKIAATRIQLRLSHEEFAAELGRLLSWSPSPGVIRAWERGTAPPPGDVLAACDLLVSGTADQRQLPLRSQPDDSQLSDGPPDDLAAMRFFREADLRLGGGRLYARVIKYLDDSVAPRLLSSAPSASNGRNVFTSAAAISDMAAWMAHDAGLDDRAKFHFDRARDLAVVSGERQLTAHVLSGVGHLAHHLNDPGNTIKAARSGLDLLKSGPRVPELEARLYAIIAKGYAAGGERSEFVRNLALAEKSLSAASEEPRSEWVSGFDEGSLASEAARSMRQLGDLTEAQRQAARVIALRPANRPRSRAFGLFVHAHVRLARGDLDEACSLVGEIISTTEALESRIVVQQLSEFRQQLWLYKSNPIAREMLSYLTPALRKRAWNNRAGVDQI